jgi:hypothetical protein
MNDNGVYQNIILYLSSLNKHRDNSSMSMNIAQEDIQSCLLEDNQTIITTVTNHGYLLYTLNMLKSLQPFGLDRKVFIVCIDKKGTSILKQLGYSVFCIEDSTLSKFCPWNTKGYDKICYLKLELIYHLLSLQKHVLLVDGDIVFHKNPIEDIQQWWKDTIHDVWIQNDSQENGNTKNMCTGYMFIKTSDRLIQLYDCVSEKGLAKYQTCAFDNNDQTYFNRFVKSACIMKPLAVERYPNGKMFYEHKDAITNKYVLVHFNWVQGHMKMAKMKEHKMWLLTPEEEEVI